LKTIYIIFITLIFTFLIQKASAQLIIDNTSMTPAQLVQDVLFIGNPSVTNITYSGAAKAIGKFSTGNNSTNLGLATGIILSTGSVLDAPGPNSSGSTTYSNGTGSDSTLASLIPGYTINDAVVLSFDFVPTNDILKISYVFASEEYPEWVGSSFNDVFGFFLSGPIPGGGTYNNTNIAIIPGTSLPVMIDNINSGSYSQYYIDNTNGSTIEYDGFTAVLNTWANLIPNASYHIKIAIGDAGDSAYDSSIFLEKGSFNNSISDSSSLCVGDTLYLFSHTIPNFAYYWTGPNNFTSDQQYPINTNVSLVDTGIYSLYLINGNDTSFYGSTTVEVFPLTPVDLGEDMVLCNNVTAILNAGSGYSSYEWKNTAFSQTLANTQTYAVFPANYGIGTHEFYVLTTNESGCISTDTIRITFQDCSGIDEMPTKELKAYPNPATNLLTIECPVTHASLSISNLLGQEVVRQPINDKVSEIDISKLGKGVYFVKVEGKEGVVVKRFLKE